MLGVEVNAASAIMSYIAKGPEQMGFLQSVHILTVLDQEKTLWLSLGLSAPNPTSWKTRKEGLAVDLAWET